MIGVRLNSFNDSSGEPEQDANSALTELDKGLRSGKVGEQCEAIVRFPRLFEKYPFPILINSSFLKLADVFRMGNNFLRLWVLRVCQQSEKHLDKILNVDEFLRRVFSVLHSNDPVARALALRTLGAVAGIIPERQNVHHAIRRGLDSHDNVEVDAAIYATTRFAEHSNAFAVAMCNKLWDMVDCESTAAERRAKLVRALRTVHGGAVRAQGVLKLLRSLLERFPSSSSVRAAITALTHIAADTVVHVPDQVELLLSISANDARSSVRRAALLGLRKLAEHAALWPNDCVEKLVRAASDAQEMEHTMLCLQVMQKLVSCPAVCAGAGSPGEGCAALRRYCSEAALSADLTRAATAADVLTRLIVHCYEENLPVEGGDLMLALETLVIATGENNSPSNIKALRVALRCLVQLSRAEPTVYAGRTAAVVGRQLGGAGGPPAAGPRAPALLEALGALAGAPHAPAHLGPAMPALHHMLEQMQRDNTIENPADDGTTLVLLCTVLLQERAARALTQRVSPAWQDRLLPVIQRADGWVRYRVARAALRYGHHRLAGGILARLAQEAPSEPAQRWLTALHRAALADAKLVEEGIAGLEEASSGWEVCSGWGGAGGAGGAGGGGCGGGCAGCGACSPLAPAWMRARAAGLAALARTAIAARTLCTQPPPAIAHAFSQTSRDPALKAGAFAPAIRKAARAVWQVAHKYSAIARTAFHADDSTLRHLQISQHTYSQLAQFLERVTSSSQERPPELDAVDLKPATLEEKIALSASTQLAEISSKLFDNPTTGPGITHRHMEAVLAAVSACSGGAVWARGVCAGRAGGALCRVSLSPAWRAASSAPSDHAATLPLSHRLALKLEGVVLPPVPLSKRQKPRQVKGVQITVTATPHPRTNEKTVELSNIPPVLTAVQTVTPVRDFFSAQQLVSVSTPGLYTVAVEAAFVDENDQLWNTGPRTAIVIKAHEDPSVKGSTQATRSRF
ncbi:integrator complex subunit 7 [Spodoptera frugiperda]|uniref:Integrator complex subunit 7 n=1 Tax=Spodoptera frugiperda TaxID=7108 RepID=A0A9R0EC36_SPOFR|nr:integrator complex subunit 7 [Spodoptera frugiperda]